MWDEWRTNLIAKTGNVRVSVETSRRYLGFVYRLEGLREPKSRGYSEDGSGLILLRAQISGSIMRAPILSSDS